MQAGLITKTEIFSLFGGCLHYTNLDISKYHMETKITLRPMNQMENCD